MERRKSTGEHWPVVLQFSFTVTAQRVTYAALKRYHSHTKSIERSLCRKLVEIQMLFDVR